MNELLHPNCELNCKFELRENCYCHCPDWDAKSFALRRPHELPMPSTYLACSCGILLVLPSFFDNTSATAVNAMDRWAEDSHTWPHLQMGLHRRERCRRAGAWTHKSFWSGAVKTHCLTVPARVKIGRLPGNQRHARVAITAVARTGPAAPLCPHASRCRFCGAAGCGSAPSASATLRRPRGHARPFHGLPPPPR